MVLSKKDIKIKNINIFFKNNKNSHTKTTTNENLIINNNKTIKAGSLNLGPLKYWK